MSDIVKVINKQYSPIKNYKVGDSMGREKSWEWCHAEFLKAKKNIDSGNKLTKDNIDYLALHLFCYLASWGMLRNSKLLSCDYKVFLDLIPKIMNTDYRILWDYNPKKLTIKEKQEAEVCLFDNGIYKEIEDYLDSKKVSPTNTLVTKILLGTFACLPAFDTEVNKGLRKYKKNNPSICKIDYPGFKGYDEGTVIDKKIFASLSNFIEKNYFDIYNTDPAKSKMYYPPMKMVDMYFNQLGQ